MRPAAVDLEIYLGDDVSFVLAITNAGVAVNLTGRTYRAFIKENPTTYDMIGEFTVTNGGSNGLITLSLIHSYTDGWQTAKLNGGALEQNCYWDLEQESGGSFVTIAAGRCNLIRDITR